MRWEIRTGSHPSKVCCGFVRAEVPRRTRVPPGGLFPISMGFGRPADWCGASKLGEFPLGHDNATGWLPPTIPSAFVGEYILGPGLVKAADPNAVRLWDRKTGQPVKSFSGHSGIPTCCAMSPDGSRILSCAPDFSVRLWQAKSGRQLLCLDKLNTHLRCVAFSLDGKRFATGGEDHTVRLWDCATGKELCHFEGHSDVVHCVAFSPDGTLVASGGSDNTVRLWPLPASR